MPLPTYAVEGRANLVARAVLVFDLALGVALFASGAPLLWLVAPAASLLLLVTFLRFVKRSPAVWTFLLLSVTAGLLAIAPQAMGAVGVGLWALYPVIPVSAGFVLGRRRLLWRMAGITAAIAGAGALVVIRGDQPWALDRIAIAALAVAVGAAIGLITWFAARALQPESGRREMLGVPLTVVRGVVVAPLNRAVGGVQSDGLRRELEEMKRQYNPRWLVLDLAPAGDLGHHDLNAIEQAAASANSAQCSVVLARPPADALGHLDFAQSVVNRVERFATVAQATETGLRRLGWAQNPDQAQRLSTSL